MNRIVSAISSRLSLRKPQKESLEILAEVIEHFGLNKQNDPQSLQEKLAAVNANFPSVTDFEREFPSLCFALATGVGKTRLMGAFIAYLHMAKGIRNFFVLAPNLTIYEKLIQDFTPNTPKYVFKGLSSFANKQPNIITGDNYEQQALFLEDPLAVNINIFNISKINSEVRGGKSPRIKRLSEYLGQSYYDYLKSLPDLVLLMDESHRYRATAGVKAINELNPILGLELTATPQVESGSKTIPFKNVIYSYPLYKAMEDGYVKEPAVATRENFNPEKLSQEQLERLKLEDGVRVHEETKLELELYARENNEKLVKPFILVVAQDTKHAEDLMNMMENDDFFGGRYKGKVITVHSNQRGEEKDETIKELLALEDPHSKVEIVIHVNMLKEGWDVTNLYTIIPLRAANSKTLVEQSIGRGLRLPYGKRTGVPAVDRLTIIAHDKFQEIIDEANNPTSIIRRGVVIGRDIAQTEKKMVVVESNVEATLIEQLVGENKPVTPEEEKKIELKKSIAETVVKTIANKQTLYSSKQLKDPSVQQQIIHEVNELYTSSQLSWFEEEPQKIVENMVAKAVELIPDLSIEIPRVILQPTGDISWGYHDFDLDCSVIPKLQPVAENILIEHLRTHEREWLQIKKDVREAEEHLENYIVFHLIDYPNISYDDHAELLYKLSGQLIAYLRSYLKEEDVKNVVVYNAKRLAQLIYAQMKAHYYEEQTNYEVIVRVGFDTLKSNVVTVDADEEVRDFRQPITNKSSIRGMCFGGFTKCLYRTQKFESNAERRFAVICESDPSVLKWLKPTQNHLKIYYNQTKAYIPDFIVETNEKMYICEIKATNKIEDDKEVKAKAKAAITWCQHASDHARANNGKEWVYLLIPHDDVDSNKTIKGLEALYRQN
ncbi:DEAD/DEAH box helicase family protein [Anoxybacillus sp. LAT_35]|uniref:DEAD/DEAH box helicase n=1 Tax=unclassified Anoxybacillus TaxID=2639704 RepID=UPI001ED9EEEB|nr:MULTISPECIES: DEAD/DEAH box helicase family protein [unclassified Anoxybacillus]MCG5025721.1 DEAD/DEAH box helicase family protein [Anoxybacillus flavithermus]MCG6196060.1 DEAD/DEAH box helicase family protein [Anoxybacillus sp. LAT_38]MCG3084076.1 DEAD/DEAH box helicase family protein [Anoxybacillus sp. LAT27]MCG6170621.1 DEAD/DEAH box helicase family protein [Anoxybacillus sp. LAT_11]MCG6174762.1 DEAD/DEAH box helicase family protein [Anoxybacillus sp. LAT_31]